ncbi:MAG: hypothetical protein AB7D28_02110 [Candidatus Berkiella sp.]
MSKISYIVTDTLAVIKLSGEIRLLSSTALEEAYRLVSEQRQSQPLWIDLTESFNLDSTIYGTIAKFCLLEAGNHQITLYYTHENIYKQLHTLGIEHLCLLKRSATFISEVDERWHELVEKEIDKDELKLQVQHAHQVLAKLSPSQAMQLVVDQISKNTRNH